MSSKSIQGCIAHLQTNVEWGGGENQVLQLLPALHAKDVNVVLWARADGVLYKRALERGYPTHSLPTGITRALAPAGIAQLCRDLKAAGTVLLHVHDSEGLDLGIRVRRRTGLPLVYNRRIASPIRPGWISQRKYAATKIDAVIAISETVRRVMAASCLYPADRIYIAPTGVNATLLQTIGPDKNWRRAQGGRFIAGGLGRLAPKKNWSFLVQTAAACRTSLPDLRWVVAGEGPEHAALIRLTKDLGVDDIVQFIGFRADGACILKSLDLFFPSLREGASVTIREAMLMGVPVAAMNAEGSMESLGGHGWVLEPDKVDVAVAAVREILENTVHRETVTQAAREFAQKMFTFERTAADTLAVYERVLSDAE